MLFGVREGNWLYGLASLVVKRRSSTERSCSGELIYAISKTCIIVSDKSLICWNHYIMSIHFSLSYWKVYNLFCLIFFSFEWPILSTNNRWRFQTKLGLKLKVLLTHSGELFDYRFESHLRFFFLSFKQCYSIRQR